MSKPIGLRGGANIAAWKYLKYLSVKLPSIAILANMYLGTGVIASSFIKKYICKKIEDDDTKIIVLLHLFWEVACIMIAVFFIRKLVRTNVIVLMFENIGKFKLTDIHSERTGGIILAFSFLLVLGPCIKVKAEKIYSLERWDTPSFM